MPQTLIAESAPLLAAEDGVLRLEGTRVPLETIVAAYLEGATAEEIVEQYPTVSLTAAYRVIGYYLGHRSELDTYVQERAAQRAAVQEVNESRWPPNGLRERLLSRRK